MKRILSCVLVMCLICCFCALGVSARTDVSVTVTNITWDGANQPKPNDAVVFSVHLKNSGTTALAKGTAVNVSLYINQEKVFSETYENGIPAGGTVAVKMPKWKAVAGEHVVTAVLNNTVPTKNNWVEKQHLVANIRVAEKALTVPEIAQKYGMTTLTFSDDFTTLDLFDKEATGAYGYRWYTNIPYGAKDASPTDYRLTEAGLSVEREPTLFAWTLCTLDCTTGTGWGYTHGYLEMRFRTPGKLLKEGGKGKPAVWSLPPEKIMSLTSRYLETDFLEFVGNDSFSSTLHDLGYNGKNEATRWYKNSNFQHLGLRDDEWHTMGFVRRNGSWVCYLDGKEYMSVYWEEGEKPYPNSIINVPGDEIGAYTIADEQLMPLILHGAKDWPLEIDYIQVWEGDEKANQGESVEVGQLLDMYLRDGDGQINLNINYETYETLIDVEESFNALSSEKKEQLNRLAKREVGKTLVQVTSEAKQFKKDLETFMAAYAFDSKGVLLDTSSLDACKVIVKGETQWKKMSQELRYAINTSVFLTSNAAATYDNLLEAALKKVPTTTVKTDSQTVATTQTSGVGSSVSSTTTTLPNASEGGAEVEPDSTTNTVVSSTDNTVTTDAESPTISGEKEPTSPVLVWIVVAVIIVAAAVVVGVLLIKRSKKTV